MADQVPGATPNQDPAIPPATPPANPGWISALPDEFKQNDFVKTFQKPGDFVKTALEIKTEHDALKTKLEGAIFKPGEGAKPEEVAAYRKAMGIPEKAEEYEFPKGEGIEHDEKMTTWARDVFHKAGLSKESAAVVSQAWDGFIQGMVQEQQKAVETAKTAATEALKKEWGADFDKNLEFTKRGWKKFTDTEFDAFCNESGIGNNPALIKFVYKIGQAMGEDWTPQGSQQRQGDVTLGIKYDKSPAPPKN